MITLRQQIEDDQRAWSPGRAATAKVRHCNLHNDCDKATEHAREYDYEVTHCTSQCDDDCVGEECV